MNANKSKNNRFKNRRSNFSNIDISQFDFQTIYEYEQQKSDFQDDFDDEYGYKEDKSSKKPSFKDSIIERYSLDNYSSNENSSDKEDYNYEYLDNVVIEGDDYGYGQKYDLSHQDNIRKGTRKVVSNKINEDFDELGYLKQKYNLNESESKRDENRHNLDDLKNSNDSFVNKSTNVKKRLDENRYNLDDYIKKSGISDDVLKYNVDEDILKKDVSKQDILEHEVLKQEMLTDNKKLTDIDNNHATPKNTSSFRYKMGMMSNMRKIKSNVNTNETVKKDKASFDKNEEYREKKIDRELVKDFIEDEKDKDLDFLFSDSKNGLKKDTVEGISEYGSKKSNPFAALSKRTVFYKKDDEANSDEDILKDYEKNELPIIELCDVHKEYQEGIEAVNNISFKINKGEFVFIVGKSGSGKSTLINLLTRQIRPTSGNVYVNGREIATLANKKISKYRRSIGVVFQDFKLLPDRNVFDNVAFAQRVIEKTEEEISMNVPEILTMVGLNERCEAFPNELSGGEKQRVAIARALVNEPSILLADEPTGNLDPKTAWEIMDLLDEINKKGTTVIVVTHNVDIVNIMKKRVIAIEDGEVVSDKREGEYIHED